MKIKTIDQEEEEVTGITSMAQKEGVDLKGSPIHPSSSICSQRKNSRTTSLQISKWKGRISMMPMMIM
jgi:hypothetical protein